MKVIVPVFSALVVVIAVLVMDGPPWAVIGLGAVALVLSAQAEDHAHENCP